MKKLLYAAAALLMAACQQLELPETEEVQTAETRRFTFTIKGDFLSPEFTDGKRKANAYMTADGAEMTDLWVIDAVSGDQSPDLTIKQTLHQTSTDADWGAPSMPLTLGTHHIKFLASRGQQPSYADGVVTWKKPLDTFYCDYEVTVTKTSNGNRSVTLERVATRLQVVVEDALPEACTAIAITPAKWYTGWNMLTGEPVEGNYSVTHEFPRSWVGLSGNAFNVWGMSAAEEWTTDVQIAANAGTATLSTAQITAAPMLANRTTIYRGALFSVSAPSSVNLSAEWAKAYEGIY